MRKLLLIAGLLFALQSLPAQALYKYTSALECNNCSSSTMQAYAESRVADGPDGVHIEWEIGVGK